MGSINNPIAARISYTERNNFLTNLVNTSLYKDKISFVEGNDNDIPNSIWTNGKKFADVGNIKNFEQLLTNKINEAVYSYFDSNYNNIPDWEDYFTTYFTPTKFWVDYKG